MKIIPPLKKASYSAPCASSDQSPHALFRSYVTLLGAGLFVTSCVNPNQPNGGYFAMDPKVAAQNRAFTHAIENDSQQFRHRERMSQATATELATRNAPRVIYHPGFYGHRWWW
jgi:hypothetical protein